MLLLHHVNEDNFDDLYAEFTVDQPEEDKLSKDSFAKLSARFHNLTPSQIDTQIRASVIAAITLSPKAQELATTRLGESSFPYDSVMFSGKTVTDCGDMYPIYKSAEPKVQIMLRFCFPDDNRHWRHAFFLENSSCLKKIQRKTTECDIDSKESLKEEISTWLTYWLINALGFNGHIGTLQGSSFMTESVFQRAMMLNETIDKLSEDSTVDVFKEYCILCLNYLNVKVLNPEIAILVVRTLNMANIFNVDAAKDLKQYIATQRLLPLAQHHNEVFKSGKIATYLPGFLQNVWAIASTDKKIEILLHAISWASKVIENSDAPITSFRLVDKAKIEQLIDSGFSDEPKINKKGEITITAESTHSLSPL